MVKKIGLIITLLIVLVFSLLNLYLFYNPGNVSYNNFSGKAIGNLPDLPFNLNISLLAFILQWILLIAIVVVAYVKFMKKKMHDTLNLSYSQLKTTKKRFETDFDILYKLLIVKKKLAISNIAKIFEITQEQALDWAKIMETNELVEIEYPAFSEPVIILKQKEEVKEEDGEEETQTTYTQKMAVEKVKKQKKKTRTSHKRSLRHK